MNNRTKGVLLALSGLLVGALATSVAFGVAAADPRAGLAAQRFVQPALQKPAAQPSQAPGASGMMRGPRGWGGPRAQQGQTWRPVDILADLTGLDADKIIDRLHDGESLADIAESEGISLDKLVDAIVDVRAKALDKAVENGRLTEEQRDDILENMRSRIEERLESDESYPAPGHGPGGPGHMRGMMGNGYGAGACWDYDQSDTTTSLGET